MNNHPSPIQGEHKTRDHFINNIVVGNVIAFNFEEVMLSGRVISISENEVTVRTKNGSIFYPKKDSIVWVLTGNRWPLGIYNALRFSKKGI